MKTRNTDRILITSGTGRIGQRIVDRLDRRGIQSRAVSRSTTPAFDWHDPTGWDAALNGVTSAYLAYLPDLVIPGAEERVAAFIDRAKVAGVKRLVLLSGRGETEGYGSEDLVRKSGLEWTIIRAAWFMQNFTEGGFTDMVIDGMLAVPAGDVPEPFVDVNDIADVAVAALTEDRHRGETYEVTGPSAVTFRELAQHMTLAIGAEISFMQITLEEWRNALEQAGLPDDMVWLMGYLFGTVLDGRNSMPGDGVQRALGREPTSLTAFLNHAATDGIWDKVSGEAA